MDARHSARPYPTPCWVGGVTATDWFRAVRATDPGSFWVFRAIDLL
jgi:hypothetical protein